MSLSQNPNDPRAQAILAALVERMKRERGDKPNIYSPAPPPIGASQALQGSYGNL